MNPMHGEHWVFVPILASWVVHLILLYEFHAWEKVGTHFGRLGGAFDPACVEDGLPW